MSDKLLESILNFVLNNMGNREMMHLNHYIESRAEFWQEIQKLKADREVMIEALKYSESQFRYIYNISSTPDIGECAKYCAEKANQALKSIGEIE